MVHQHITYLGELRCEAVHGPSGVSLITDAPTDNQGRGESFSPTDLIVTALATCITTVAGILASSENVKLEGTKIYAEKHMSTKPPRKIIRIILKYEMPKGIPNEFRPKLNVIASNCPVRLSIHQNIDVSINFNFPD